MCHLIDVRWRKAYRTLSHRGFMSSTSRRTSGNLRDPPSTRPTPLLENREEGEGGGGGQCSLQHSSGAAAAAGSGAARALAARSVCRRRATPRPSVPPSLPRPLWRVSVRCCAEPSRTEPSRAGGEGRVESSPQRGKAEPSRAGAGRRAAASQCARGTDARRLVPLRPEKGGKRRVVCSAQHSISIRGSDWLSEPTQSSTGLSVTNRSRS